MGVKPEFFVKLSGFVKLSEIKTRDQTWPKNKTAHISVRHFPERDFSKNAESMQNLIYKARFLIRPLKRFGNHILNFSAKKV